MPNPHFLGRMEFLGSKLVAPSLLGVLKNLSFRFFPTQIADEFIRFLIFRLETKHFPNMSAYIYLDKLVVSCYNDPAGV